MTPVGFMFTYNAAQPTTAPFNPLLPHPVRPSPQKHRTFSHSLVSLRHPPLRLRRRPAIHIVPDGRGMDRPKKSAAAAPCLPDDAGAEPIEMVSNKAAASGRSGGVIRIGRRRRLRPAAAAAWGCYGGGIGRLRLRPAIPVVSGGRGKRRRTAVAVPLLPDDALVDILSRVPGKSLCRFKCVSRAWRDLITDRLRCTRLPQTLEGFFINDDKMPSDDREDDGSDRVVGRFINMLGRIMPLASFSFLGNQPGIQEFSLMGSCNGLLLFGHRRAGDTYDSLGYIVCNPATKQWVAVPSSGFKPLSLLDEGFDPGSDIDPDIECAFTYLIFNPAVSSHFQLVEFISDDVACVEVVRAYSSETGVWCRTEWSSDEAISFFTESAFVSGMLHFSVTNLEAHQEQVVAVDAKGNRCRIITGPEKSCDVVFIGQSKGRLHYMSRRTDSTSKMTELSIWVLQEYNTEDWVLKHKVSFLHLFGRMSCQNQDYNVVTIHPDRDLIFFFQHWDLQLKSYDMDSKEVCTLCTLGVGPQNIFPLVPYYAESVVLANKH